MLVFIMKQQQSAYLRRYIENVMRLFRTAYSHYIESDSIDNGK